MIHKFIKKCNFDHNSIIFEIGSHMGFDTEEMHKNTNGAKIYCFEPDPRNIKILYEREIDKIATINELAISDRSLDSCDFYLSSGEIPSKTGNHYYDDNDWSASSSMRRPKIHNEEFPWCKIENLIKVKTISLDDFCEKNNINHCNFIWMDVQGCEDLVFLGAQKILKNTEYIYTEYSNKEMYEGQKNLDQIISMLPGKWAARIIHEGDVLLENIDYREALIANTGAWNIKNDNEHVFDSGLADEILNLLIENKINNCLDLGCGNGKYTRYFNSHQIKTLGYDGNPHTPEITNGLCQVLDLAKTFNLNCKYDCVMSLEVGEHIPAQYEDVFIENITSHCKNLLILSWGVPGQEGYGHVNCQTNEYIINKIEKYGFKNNAELDFVLRQKSDNVWFKNTILTFKKI